MRTENDAIFWLPPGEAVITRLGIIQAAHRKVLTPDEHEKYLSDRLQSLVDKAGVCLRRLDQLVETELAAHGFAVGIRTLKTAGDDLIGHLADRLRAKGALISTATRLPFRERAGVQLWYDETTLEEWVQRASVWLR